MNVDLDQLLTRLRVAPPDRRLDQLEARVWARIESDSLEAVRGGIWGWPAVLAAAMLCIGVFAGGVEAPNAHESSPFEIHSSFAPSTLLEGGR